MPVSGFQFETFKNCRWIEPQPEVLRKIKKFIKVHSTLV